MYVCMYVCIYIAMYVCVYVCMCVYDVCMYFRDNVCVEKNSSILYIYKYIFIYL
jgi:hypothetical protein